jgi:hypothetical protein
LPHHPNAWCLPFELAQEQVNLCGPEKMATYIRVKDGPVAAPAGDDLVERATVNRTLQAAFGQDTAALLARIIAVEAERDALAKQTGPDMWCLACGTVTRDNECDCTMYLELPEGEPSPQRLVNLANELGRIGREAYIRAEAAEARVKVLEKGLRSVVDLIDDGCRHFSVDPGWAALQSAHSALAPEPS